MLRPEVLLQAYFSAQEISLCGVKRAAGVQGGGVSAVSARRRGGGTDLELSGGSWRALAELERRGRNVWAAREKGGASRINP